ncbi:MAG TPA: phosphate acyltransferase [Gemmatimonadaceae bacterium]|nr:phosphate acyltransferase [Gemmatimonadaceae bacterium]
MSFLSAVCARASALGARVAFGEAGDERVLDAAMRLKREGVATPILVLDSSDASGSAAARKTGLECVDPASDPRVSALSAALLRSRAKHGMSEAEAATLGRDPLAFSIWLAKSGAVDAAVGGAVRTTRELMHFALWLIGPAEGVKTVSSAFYMVVPPFRAQPTASSAQLAAHGPGADPLSEVLTFTDCSVVPTPTPSQLADIAIAAAGARKRIVGDVPRVALLSYSTKGSGGDGASIATVQAALALIRERAPELKADGDLQADAALIADIAARKAPGSPVAGSANILVFPNLDAGNIAYKLTERLAHAKAIGPILQGLALPVSDLSRGADADAIFHVAAVTALQSPRFHPSGDRFS